MKYLWYKLGVGAEDESNLIHASIHYALVLHLSSSVCSTVPF